MFRYLALGLAVCLFGLVGCAPSKSDIDKTIKDEIKKQLGSEVTATDLTKQPNGGYTGTATTANGDVYDVEVTPPSGGQYQLKAVPGPKMVEKMARDAVEEANKLKVKTVNLKRQSLGVYTGSVITEEGPAFNVTTTLEGSNVNLKAVPVQ